MQPVSLQVALLKERLPELVLRPGMRVVARVVSQEAGRGVLALAGATLRAELPAELKAGERLRLEVSDVAADRVTMRLVESAGMPVAAPLPPPGEQRPRVRIDDEAPAKGAAEEREGVALVFESPRLGPMGLRLQLSGGGIVATVTARPGDPASIATAAADELREALAAVVGGPAEVTVRERRDPVDVYA